MANASQKEAHASGRLRTVVLTIAAQAFHSLAFGSVGLFLPLIRKDLDISYTQAGVLSATSILVYAIMQVPAGFLADRYSPKRLFCTGLLGAMLFAITLGLVQNYWQAVVNQAFAGFFRSLLFIPGLTLVTRWFAPTRRATVMSVYSTGGFAGLVVLDLIGPLVAREVGWRVVFLTFPLVGVATAAALLRFGREPPRVAGQAQVTLRETAALFRMPFMWVTGSVQYIRLATVTGIQFWLPTLLVDERGLALTSVGLVIALRDFTTAASNPIGGYVSDRLRNPPLVIAFALAMLGITTGLLVAVNSLPVLILVITVNAMFVQFYFGALFQVPVEVLGPRTAGSTTGFNNLFANLGSFTFALLLGALKDATGSFAVGFGLVAAVCAVGLVFTAVLARMRSDALRVQPATSSETT
ncbi:MAG: MFS transporter [Dehalococcoidia bacterium]|nr:MFS transporter [Dehalococcoidia bacterium]